MDFQEWFNGIPRVTRAWFAGAFVLTVAGNFGVVNPGNLVLVWSAIKKFQIWRLVTCGLFFGKLGFPFLINLMFLYQYSKRLQEGQYENKEADYVYFLTFIWGLLAFVGLFVIDMYIIGVSLVLSVVYVWCHLNRDQIVSFWFGMKFKALYFPWVLLFFNILLGGSGISELLGIVAGHSYVFLRFIYPSQPNGLDLLATPAIFHRWFPSGTHHGIVNGYRAPVRTGAPRDANPPPQRDTWGRGQVLGRE